MVVVAVWADRRGEGVGMVVEVVECGGEETTVDCATACTEDLLLAAVFFPF